MESVRVSRPQQWRLLWLSHDDVMTWNLRLHYWPFVMGSHGASGNNTKFQRGWTSSRVTIIWDHIMWSHSDENPSATNAVAMKFKAHTYGLTAHIYMHEISNDLSRDGFFFQITPALPRTQRCKSFSNPARDKPDDFCHAAFRNHSDMISNTAYVHARNSSAVKSQLNPPYLDLTDNSGCGLSQWETTLQCNVVSHWLSPYPELSLEMS